MGRSPTYPDIRDGIWELAGATLSAVPSASELTIRLYGGWHGSVPESRVHVRPMVSRAIDSLPKRQGRQRLRIQIADHPIWDSSIRMLDSVRVTPLSRVRASLDPSPDCIRGSNCSIATFAAWSRGACPQADCPVRLRDVAQNQRQKMVDTLMSVDAVVIAHRGIAQVIVMATDDDDFVPAFLALLTCDVGIVHLTRRPRLRIRGKYYTEILERAGVHINTW